MLNLSDFGARGDRSDTTPAARAAVRALRTGGNRRLVLPPSRYDFWPDFAAERYLFVSNNDEGLKRIAFDLRGIDDVEIDGQGSLLVFHGHMVPFVVERSARVRLSNLAIDWARPFHTEAAVLSADPDGVELHIDESFPYRVEHGRLVFQDEAGRGSEAGVGNILEFDPVRRETAFMARDNYGIGRRYAVRDLGGRRVRFTADFHDPRPTPGNVLALTCGRRECPAFVLTRSSDVELAGVTIHHAGGMGVLAQRCENVTLRRVAVTPPAGRLISATADATHFVNCRGHVQVVDCRFENQLDDPLNCHGVYGRVVGRPDARTVDLRLVHRQQWGFDLADVGSRMEFARAGSLSAFHEGTVTAVETINREVSRVTFDGGLPADLTEADAAVDVTWTCDLTVRGTTARGNRARGVLISTPGKVLIEDNTFHTPGAAVLIEGDANYWYESGPVRDVLIRGNLFDNCNYGVWGKAAIQVTPGVCDEAQPSARYHRNIRVENNSFVAFDRRLVHARCVDGLTFRGNTILASDEYPRQHADGEPFNVVHCSNVHIEGNIYEKQLHPHFGDRAAASARSPEGNQLACRV